MGRRSTDAYKTDNPTDKTDYSKFSGYENYGRASSEISGSILDKSSEGYKDTVITGGEDKATNKIGSFYKQTDDEIKAKEGKGELTTAEKLKAELDAKNLEGMGNIHAKNKPPFKLKSRGVKRGVGY
jgi:hypothetical protein